jgi:hypothetical protein
MKNQYVGDVNDFVKYALLRSLAQTDATLAVIWMLTTDDARSDGGRVNYLERPVSFRAVDPAAFDVLRRVVMSGQRQVRAIEESGLLPHSRFISAELSDALAERAVYMEAALTLARGASHVFFDPDNGIGVRSVPKGRASSSKYVYHDEIGLAYAQGASVVIYQHFPRQPRLTFLEGVANELVAKCACMRPLAVTLPHVAFIILPQASHEKRLKMLAQGFVQRSACFSSDLWPAIID